MAPKTAISQSKSCRRNTPGPFSPAQRTSLNAVGMSALCDNRHPELIRSPRRRERIIADGTDRPSALAVLPRTDSRDATECPVETNAKSISAPQMGKMTLIYTSDAVCLCMQSGCAVCPTHELSLIIVRCRFRQSNGGSHANFWLVFVFSSNRRGTSCPSKGTARTHRVGLQPARLPQRLGGVHCCHRETTGAAVLREGSRSTIENSAGSEPLRIRSTLVAKPSVELLTGHGLPSGWPMSALGHPIAPTMSASCPVRVNGQHRHAADPRLLYP